MINNVTDRNFTAMLRKSRSFFVVFFIAMLVGCGNVSISEIDTESALLQPLKPTATSADDAISYVMPTATSPRLAVVNRKAGVVQGAELNDDAGTLESENSTGDSAEALAATTETSGQTSYVVEEGDTLRIIAINHAMSIEVLQKANNLDSEEIEVGQTLIIPTSEQIVQYEIEDGIAIPAAQNDQGELVHYIQPGETISSIAESYEVDRNDLLFANGYRPDVQLVAGTSIIIPQGDYVALPTATALIVVGTVTSTPVAVAQAPIATPRPTTAATRTYVVESGDYARLIVEENDITMEALQAANPGVDMDALQAGQEINIPAGNGSSTSPGGAVAAPTSTPTATVVPPTPTPAVTVTSGFQVTNPVPVVPTPSAQAPILSLPENGSVWTYTTYRKPFQFVWTPMSWLDEDHYYVVQLWAENDDNKVLWTESVWLQATSWRMPTVWLDRLDDDANLYWNVRVMELTSGDPALTVPNDLPVNNVIGEESSAVATATAVGLPRGQVISKKSDTYAITIVVP